MKEQNVPEKHVFWLRSGRHIRNLNELVKELHHMDKATFHHHVTPERNDFSNWILHVIKDKQLAARVRASHDKQITGKIVEEHLQEIRKPIKLVVKGSSEVKPATKKFAKLVRKSKPAKVKRVKRKPVVKKKLPQDKKVSEAPRRTVIRKGPTTPLTVSTPRRIVKKGKTTQLHIGEKLRAKEGPHPLVHISSYMVLGVMMGVGIAVISLILL